MNKATVIWFKVKDEEYTGTLISQKGNTLLVSVQDDEDAEKVREVKVQVKQVTHSCFEEETDEAFVQTCVTQGFPPIVETITNHVAPETPKKEKKAKKEPSGLIPLKDICAELKIVPRIARRKLRKAKGLVGTGGAWEFNPADVEDIKALLSAVEEE